MKVCSVRNDLENSIQKNEYSKSNDSDFATFLDPITQGICENVKDPIDREEDLRLWEDIKAWVTPKDYSYGGFKKLKSSIASFPPLTAPGRIRKAYREYMEKLPKDAKKDLGFILNITYQLYVKDKNINPSNWNQVLRIMKEHIGEIGDPAVVNFGLLNKILDECGNFYKEVKEDERYREIVI